jgi:lysophospholipase L1-like esterase
LGAAVVAVALAEVGARWFLPGELTVRFVQRQAQGGELQRVDIASILENDPDLFWRLTPSRTMPETSSWARGVIANAQGFREDHEIAVPKPAGQVRILFLGDSCTFGSGLLHNETFVEQTERLLRERAGGADVECINGGVPGYSLFQGWRFLETRGFDLDPDLVVLTFGWNDRFGWDGQGDLAHFERERAARPPAALAWSRVARAVWRLRAPRDAAPAAPAGQERARLTGDEFRDLLVTIHRAAQARGVDLLLVVWPGRFNLDPKHPPQTRTEYQRALNLYAASQLRFGPNGVPGEVDLVPLFQSWKSNHTTDELFLDLVHATAFANREIATAIAARIAPWMAARQPRG